jgi:hypothetical protein
MHLQNQKLVVVLTQGNVFNSFPDNDARNVSTGSHPPIAEKVSPVPIRFYMVDVGFIWMEVNGKNSR